MTQQHRVTNPTDKPIWFAYNGRTVIWDPHPKFKLGKFALVANNAVIPIPKHIPAALRDTVYTPVDGIKGDRLAPVDGVGQHAHSVPTEMMRMMQANGAKTHKDPFQNTSGLVFDEQHVDALNIVLEAGSQRAAEIAAQVKDGEEKLKQLQAQIEAAQQQAKAAGLLTQAQLDAGIPQPKGRVIG